MEQGVSISIERMDGGPRLLIEDADRLTEAFFLNDASSWNRGQKAYDDFSGSGEVHQITDEDIRVINTTMRARSPHDKWTDLTGRPEPMPWLKSIPLAWDLIGMDRSEWDECCCTGAIHKALTGIRGPYRNLSVATKVLHLKRPALFPVLDSLVCDQLGGSDKAPEKLIEHIREQGRANLAALDAIRSHLAATAFPDGRQIIRTRVRILDALLWSSHPLTSLKVLAPWERVMRLRCEA